MVDVRYFTRTTRTSGHPYVAGDELDNPIIPRVGEVVLIPNHGKAPIGELRERFVVKDITYGFEDPKPTRIQHPKIKFVHIAVEREKTPPWESVVDRIKKYCGF
ncbi:MAG TPA: hypothetical protein VJA47_03400 [archaeon]|nr:hypothetical protein [archaeon]